MAFQKGQSGNPGGMHKGYADIKALAREHAPAAISALAAIMNDTNAPPAARVSAITALLDRGFGKPAQPVTGEGGEGAVQIFVRTGIDRD